VENHIKVHAQITWEDYHLSLILSRATDNTQLIRSYIYWVYLRNNYVIVYLGCFSMFTQYGRSNVSFNVLSVAKAAISQGQYSRWQTWDLKLDPFSSYWMSPLAVRRSAWISINRQQSKFDTTVPASSNLLTWVWSPLGLAMGFVLILWNCFAHVICAPTQSFW
jgi:hypothetical protein